MGFLIFRERSIERLLDDIKGKGKGRDFLSDSEEGRFYVSASQKDFVANYLSPKGITADNWKLINIYDAYKVQSDVGSPVDDIAGYFMAADNSDYSLTGDTTLLETGIEARLRNLLSNRKSFREYMKGDFESATINNMSDYLWRQFEGKYPTAAEVNKRNDKSFKWQRNTAIAGLAVAALAIAIPMAGKGKSLDEVPGFWVDQAEQVPGKLDDLGIYLAESGIGIFSDCGGDSSLIPPGLVGSPTAQPTAQPTTRAPLISSTAQPGATVIPTVGPTVMPTATRVPSTPVPGAIANGNGIVEGASQLYTVGVARIYFTNNLATITRSLFPAEYDQKLPNGLPVVAGITYDQRTNKAFLVLPGRIAEIDAGAKGVDLYSAILGTNQKVYELDKSALQELSKKGELGDLAKVLSNGGANYTAKGKEPLPSTVTFTSLSESQILTYLTQAMKVVGYDTIASTPAVTIVGYNGATTAPIPSLVIDHNNVNSNVVKQTLNPKMDLPTYRAR